MEVSSKRICAALLANLGVTLSIGGLLVAATDRAFTLSDVGGEITGQDVVAGGVCGKDEVVFGAHDDDAPLIAQQQRAGGGVEGDALVRQAAAEGVDAVGVELGVEDLHHLGRSAPIGGEHDVAVLGAGGDVADVADAEGGRAEVVVALVEHLGDGADLGFLGHGPYVDPEGHDLPAEDLDVLHRAERLEGQLGAARDVLLGELSAPPRSRLR